MIKGLTGVHRNVTAEVRQADQAERYRLSASTPPK